MDFLKIAAAEVASISERRIYLLLDATRSGLPPFPGQQTWGRVRADGCPECSWLLSSLKTKSWPIQPALTRSPPLQGWKTTLAWHPSLRGRLPRSWRMPSRVVSIELLTASQGLYMSKPLQPGRGVAQALDMVRDLVAPLEGDRSTSQDIEDLTGLVRSGELSRPVDCVDHSPLKARAANAVTLGASGAPLPEAPVIIPT